MNENTKNLKDIYNFCKYHKHFGVNRSDGLCLADCPLRRNCIESTKRSRYNDPRFVAKCVAKIERALAKERAEANMDPFAEIEE